VYTDKYSERYEYLSINNGIEWSTHGRGKGLQPDKIQDYKV
jgi:hypothetical protein